ncbi:MAG: tRNA (adenosine(37)-N6)-threonylcarbamoyltransferase complex ATPase subunit type 1 TsaE, partial [Parachlamydiaceae bacterium]
AFGATLNSDSIVCLFGELGAGKTTFIRGLAEGLGIDPGQVSSPTFVYLNIYEGQTPLYHFDLYRLNGVEAFLSMGFDEILFSPGIKCIEWSERISEILPKEAIKITLSHEREGRKIETS